MTTFARISRRPEFEKDLKQLLKRYSSLEEDLRIFIAAQLVLFHKQKVENQGLLRIPGVGFEEPKIYKAVKFPCRSIHGRGAASGIRLIYAYFEKDDYIELIQIYFKADAEIEDKRRIKSIYGKR